MSDLKIGDVVKTKAMLGGNVPSVRMTVQGFSNNLTDLTSLLDKGTYAVCSYYYEGEFKRAAFHPNELRTLLVE